MKKIADSTRLGSEPLVVVALLTVILALSFSISSVKAPSEPKIVYVVICVDTEMWGGHNPYIGSSNPHPTMDMRTFARSPPSTGSQVFDGGFRNSHRDSFGNRFKMTWFAEMDYLMAQSNFVYADGSPAGVSGYTAIHDILMNNWGTEIQTYGDSIEYHHHFMIYDGTWKRYNNGPDAGYPEYQMYALDHMIIDRNFYPSTWRSGWLIMPPALSNWLEQWIPFDYTKETSSTGKWYPEHSTDMNRWVMHSGTSVNQSDVNAAFARAKDYGNAIYSFYCHDRDDMASRINVLQGYLNTADANEATYPNVSFKYVFAREAMQLALGFTDFTPPTFTVTSSGGTYIIKSNELLWASHPYVALKYKDGTYMHVGATQTGTNTWTITPAAGAGALLETIGVAASDLYGNPGVFVMPAPSSYYLTLDTSPTGVANPVGQDWYNAGTYASISTNEYVYTAADTRYQFKGWTTADMTKITNSSAASTTVLIDKSKTVTANYELQYRLTFGQTGLDASATSKVVTVGGSAKTYANLPFSMWVDSGTSVSYSYEANVSSSVSGKRYRLDTVSGQPSPITVTSPTTVTGNYVTQYYLTVVSPYDTPNGQDWYNAGSNAYATLANGTISGATGIRYVFTGWSGDASGTGLKSNAITMNAPKTTTANWKTQYYIAVKSAHDSPSPSTWVDTGSDFTVSVTSPTEIVSKNHQLMYTGFSVDDGAYQTGTTYTFTNVQAPHSIDFAWKQQFWIQVNGFHGSSTNSQWIDKGGTLTVSVTSPVDENSGVRYRSTGWTGTGSVPTSGTSTSVTFTINTPSTLTWNWIAQYYLTVSTNFCSVSPSSNWYDAETKINILATPPNANSNERYVWNGWIGTGNECYNGKDNPAPITINHPITETASWKPQFLGVFQQTGVPDGSIAHVIVNSVQHTLPYFDWFDKGSTINFTYEETVPGATPILYGLIQRYVLTRTSDQSLLKVEAPITLTGDYETQYATEIIVLIPAIIILSSLTSAIMFLKRRKAKPV